MANKRKNNDYVNFSSTGSSGSEENIKRNIDWIVHDAAVRIFENAKINLFILFIYRFCSSWPIHSETVDHWKEIILEEIKKG